jgi:hypothetical protein
MDESDADRPLVALGVAQLLWMIALEDQTPENALVALRLARDASNLTPSSPGFVFQYERARIAFELGRRLAAPVLLEEAVTYYGLAAEHAQSKAESRQLKRQQAEADRGGRELIAHAMWPGRGETNTTLHLEFAIESTPAHSDCWTPQPFGKKAFFKRTFLVALFEYPMVVDLRRTPRSETKFQLPTSRTTRGREITGAVMGFGSADPDQVDQLSLVMALPMAAVDAEQYARRVAHDIYEWGERVNRWLDLLSQKSPFAGSWGVTRYLYGHLESAGTCQPLTLNADEVGITHELTVPSAVRMTRFHISAVLNDLAAHPIPVAIELIRSAQHALLSHEPREAIIAAGTAAESALAIIFDSRPTTRPRDPKWTLGALVREVSRLSGCLPAGETQATIEAHLVAPRNAAVHQAVVNRRTANEAVNVSLRIVNHVFAFENGDPTRVGLRLRELAPLIRAYAAPTSGFATASNGDTPHK